MKTTRLKLKLVDGAKVRAKHVEFTMGGHGLVYNWIPKNEIWIEKSLKGCDREATVVHEQAEFAAMKNGMQYEVAHRLANGAERLYRRACPMRPK